MMECCVFTVQSFDQLSREQLYEILAHRAEVFILGQGNIYRDLDGFDQQAWHLCARDGDGVLQGYVRLLPARLHYDGYAENAFGRLSVRESARGRGLGRELVRRACDFLTQLGENPDVRISAMAYLEGFYQELGFVRTSDIFQIQGVDHVTMLYAPVQHML